MAHGFRARFEEAYAKAEEVAMRPTNPSTRVLNLATLEELRQQQLLQAAKDRRREKKASRKRAMGDTLGVPFAR